MYAASVCVQEAVMSSRGAQQALVPGRMVVTLNQRSGLPELGVVCGSPSAGAAAPAAGFGGKSNGFGGLQSSTASPSSTSAGVHLLFIGLVIKLVTC